MDYKGDAGLGFDVTTKISDEVKDYGYRQLSVQICNIKGAFSFDRAKRFVMKNLLSESQRSQGFARKCKQEENEFVCTFCQEGKRTHRFISNDSEIIPKTMQLVKELSTIRFRRFSQDITQVQIYGGGEKFVDFIMKKVVPKMAHFSECRVNSSKISQEFVRKLCLTCHRADVKTIKLDPARSKKYARILQGEKDEQ